MASGSCSSARAQGVHALRRLCMMLVLAMMAISAAQADEISLALVAAFDGMPVPAQAVQLSAFRTTGKRINCLQQNAAGVSVPASDLTAAVLPTTATVFSAAVPCSNEPLQSGIYGLLASKVQGADWAAWLCFNTQSGERVQLSGEATVVLQTGSYTCVASYTAQSPEVAAAVAAIDWTKILEDQEKTTGKVSASAAGSTCSPPTWKQPPRGKPASPLKIVGHNLREVATNRQIKINAINWFGFEIPMGMLDGLWAGGSDAATDYAKIAFQFTLLGYNAVRIPFAHKQLANTQTWWLYGDCNPMSDSDVKRRVTDPDVFTSAFDAGRRLPANLSPQPNDPPNKCNSYLPSTSNQDRFLQVIQQFIALGMYVILDYHPQGSEDQPYYLDRFVAGWKNVWSSVTCLPNFESDIAGRIFVDVMNEPDSMGIRWEPQGDRPGAEQLYLATADAIWAQSPGKVLFLFEGTGQNMFGLNWGNGFVTDTAVIAERGISDPNSFFKKLVQKPYMGQGAIISPHLYPPSITLSTFLGPDLWAQSRTAFGYLQTQGYAGKTFPILVGETGSAFATDDDKQWLNDFSDFWMARGAAKAYNSIPLDGWGWWAYNENSGDTGGIVMNGWQDYNWMKIRFMVNKLGLRPWYTTTAGIIGRKLAAAKRLLLR